MSYRLPHIDATPAVRRAVYGILKAAFWPPYMKGPFTLFAVLLIALGAVAGGLFGRMPTRTSAEGGTTPERLIADYREALKVIDDSYVDTVDHEEVADSSMQAMLWTLDPHSAFFTREEFRKL